MKINVKLDGDEDCVRDGTVTLYNIEIVTDSDNPDKVELYMIQDGQRVEGGSFDLQDFLMHVYKFYVANY